MSADELLAVLAERGVTVRIEGDALCLEPRSKVPVELIEELRAAKPVLLHRLRQPAAGDDDPVATRVLAFHATGAPWVFQPGLSWHRGQCFSCGDPLRDVLYGRCLPCSEALWRLLMDAPLDHWPGRPQ